MSLPSDVKEKYLAYMKAEKEYEKLTTKKEKAAQNKIIKALYAEYEAAKAQAVKERAEFQDRHK